MKKNLQQATGILRFTLMNDYLFHIVFQENIKILQGLLCCLLDLKPYEIIDITLENPINPADQIDGKEIILDLLITLNNNRKINIEMQVLNTKDWPERSLTYLCRSFDNLESGKNYLNVMPTIHIGILDYTLFPEYPEFYAHYAMMNVKTHNLYSDKLLLNVLDLTQIDSATDEDIALGLQHWARLFKAKTWEEIRMLASENETFEDIAETMQRALADKDVRMRCEARERYERDRISLYDSGKQDGFSEGHATGVSETLEKDIDKAIQMLHSANMPTDFIRSQLMEHYQLTEEVATEKIEQYLNQD